MTTPPPPFSLSCTPQVPELLYQLGCSLAISTFQAGKVIFISAKDADSLVQLPRTFEKAMGIALSGPKMAIATRAEVQVLVASPELALHYPNQPGTYDTLYMPRATYYTGQIDIHDLDYGENGVLYAVNTSFSCLIRINDNYSFEPVWKPNFITRLASEDRCHLNGMAIQAGKPRFVTAFGAGDTAQSWRSAVTTGGIILDVPTGELVAHGLPMPHSPRLYDNDLYVLLSATGDLARVDQASGNYEVVTRLQGFVRGMAKYGDYLFIGLSRLRKNSSTFAKLPIAMQSQQAGIAIIHLPTSVSVGSIQYHSSVDEIYDVQVLPGLRRPGILNTQRMDYQLGLATPDATYWALPESDMVSGSKPQGIS